MHELLTAIEQSIDIQAAAGSTFRAMLDRLGPRNGYEEHAMPMVLEPWPGGRWFRDLGNGAGHLWGHVQVYKPPTLLEICGPMFMSYPVASHLRLRVEEIPGGSRVSLTHKILGVMEEEHKVGVVEGWREYLSGVAALTK